jgi:hypothetical protein
MIARERARRARRTNSQKNLRAHLKSIPSRERIPAETSGTSLGACPWGTRDVSLARSVFWPRSAPGASLREATTSTLPPMGISTHTPPCFFVRQFHPPHGDLNPYTPLFFCPTPPPDGRQYCYQGEASARKSRERCPSSLTLRASMSRFKADSRRNLCQADDCRSEFQ